MKTKLSIVIALVLSIYHIGYAQKRHPKVIKEEVTQKNFLDKKTHPNSGIIKFTFADGIESNLVKRDGIWYNYNIRGEEKEKPFTSKEGALQDIWQDSKSCQALGAAAPGTVVKGKSEKGVLRDQKGAYKMVNGQKVYISTNNKSTFFSH